MKIGDIQTLYDYHVWAMRRVLAACEQLTAEQFTAANAYSHGGIQTTLAHQLDSDHAWRMLCQHNTLDYFRTLHAEDFPTVASLQARWTEEERAMREYLATLADDDLDLYIRYTTPEGDYRERVLWHCLFQVVNHGTQHLSEVAIALTDYGSSPDGLDFTAFLNEQ